VNGVRQPEFQQPTPHFDQPDARKQPASCGLQTVRRALLAGRQMLGSCIGIAQAFAMLAHL
jgi:hypothetical protein